MNETSTKEISLKWLLYRALRAWKPIVLFAVVVAVLFGGLSVGRNTIRLSNGEFMAKAEVDYQREHASWVATGENLSVQLDNLTEERERQLEYNQNSVLMKIDPLRKNIGELQLYIDYDYKLYPGMTEISNNQAGKILESYRTYMDGEMFNSLVAELKKSNNNIEQQYLREIMKISVDSANNMISVRVVNTSATACQDVLSLVYNNVSSQTAKISVNVAQHNLVKNNQSINEIPDMDLEQIQKDNLQKVIDIDIKMQEINKELRDWKKTPEPVFAYDATRIVKDGIKTVIISGVISGVGLFVVVAIYALLSGKLLDPEDMRSRFGLRLLGLLPNLGKKKAFNGITRLFSKVGGVKIKANEYDELAKTIGCGIKLDIATRALAADLKKVAFIGMSSYEDIERAVNAMGIDGYEVVCAPNVLANSESIAKVAEADCVVLVETQEKTAISDIEKELEALRAWNKPIIGAIVINADALM